MSQVNLNELVEFVARAIVSDPTEVSVEEIHEGGEITVEVQVDPRDVGRLIGRKGRTIDALRSLADGAASLDGRRATVEVVEPDDEPDDDDDDEDDD